MAGAAVAIVGVGACGLSLTRGPDENERRGRRALVGDLERAITADVNRRVAAGQLKRPAARTRCRHIAAESDLSRSSGKYVCLAITAERVPVGYLLTAFIDYRRAKLRWLIEPSPL